MDELKNLRQMASLASGRFNQYDGNDFVLPQIFKDQVKEINSNTITYNNYSAIIETKGSQHGILNIFMPNQWFYIASYFTEFYNELQKYKKYALKITTKERLKELNGKELSESELSLVRNLNISEDSKKNLVRFITDYSWWGGAKTIDRGDFYVSPILSYANLVNASQSFVADLCAFLADKQELVKAIIEGEENNHNELIRLNKSRASLQQIYYGAPGTGKSYIINKNICNESVIRTTFHPDSDYSTFVGCYKPTTKVVKMRDLAGHVIKENGMDLTEDRIVYEFVEQAFLQAYIKAWKFYGYSNEEVKSQYLVIEEINRGNCAQIFGDLFQLLDRNKWGFSDYPIQADNDMKKQLSKAFARLKISQENKDRINACYKGDTDYVQQVLDGKILLLPDNLYIWATMNTSDQSLFPIDSAFKRRWDWQYMPIAKGRKENGEELNWKIIADTNAYDWWSFLEKINEQIGATTNSEDKKLGFFFCKANNEEISAETFVGKVIFYLWNDVFKDFGFDNTIFNDEDDSTLTFDKFYATDNNGKVLVRKDKIEKFLENLGVEIAHTAVLYEEEDYEEEDEDGNTSSSTNRDYSKYSVNGVGRYGKNRLASECVKEYIKLNPFMSADEVVRNWKSLGNIVSHFIESKEEFDARTDNSKWRSIEIPCASSMVYVVKDGYGDNGKADFLMNTVNQRDWGIIIEKFANNTLEEDSDNDESNDLSETRYKYWDNFLKYINQTEYKHIFNTENRKPSYKKYYDFSIGSSDTNLYIAYDKDVTTVGYWVKKKTLYDRFVSFKTVIEQSCGELKWIPIKKACKIIKEIPFRGKTQEEQFKLMLDEIVRMRELFIKYIK